MAFLINQNETLESSKQKAVAKANLSENKAI